ncbi:carbon-nitrogen hydrolase family protein [Niveibacterium umoris]|uniref:Putative amidohydrolase n=1 Tax=Niveibacterium umoris TaxID=1193620 RepID=A0A840BHV5_9RHOO|nr:carbon-nitrogen hydrolase family protein [Niveibacterium umoris]MBB4012560.1 putative amidohydrolase [Niveibacterium umoris]
MSAATEPFTVALAAPPLARSIAEGMHHVADYVARAAAAGAALVCFPEAYVPGMRGLDFEVEAHDPGGLSEALAQARALASAHRVALVLPMEWPDASGGLLNLAWVIGPDGTVLGSQTKNQLDPGEDATYTPGDTRNVFDLDGVRIGIVICHEGWRYPETVRWAAMRGAQLVLHPHFGGSDFSGEALREWGAADGPIYEKAMQCRAAENTVWFASVNVGLRHSVSGSAVIAPDGLCVAHLGHDGPGLLVTTIDLAAATGGLARRYAPTRYRDAGDAA